MNSKLTNQIVAGILIAFGFISAVNFGIELLVEVTTEDPVITELNRKADEIHQINEEAKRLTQEFKAEYETTDLETESEPILDLPEEVETTRPDPFARIGLPSN